MFQSILTKTVTLMGAMLFVFALVSMVSGVANAQSGSTGFGGGSATRAPTPAQFGGGSGTTQQFGGGSGTTQQFGGGGSGTTQQFGGGSGTTQGGGAPNQNCNCGEAPAEPMEPPFDCSQCGLPPLPNISQGGWHYPQLQPSGLGGILRRRNCCP